MSQIRQSCVESLSYMFVHTASLKKKPSSLVEKDKEEAL